MAPSHHTSTLRGRRPADWRGARHLVIEGEARVVGRRSAAGSAQPPRRAVSEPVWGSALGVAARLPLPRSVPPRLAIPAGLALAILAVLALSPAEPERQGSGPGQTRMAAAPVAP